MASAAARSGSFCRELYVPSMRSVPPMTRGFQLIGVLPYSGPGCPGARSSAIGPLVGRSPGDPPAAGDDAPPFPPPEGSPSSPPPQPISAAVARPAAPTPPARSIARREARRFQYELTVITVPSLGRSNRVARHRRQALVSQAKL